MAILDGKIPKLFKELTECLDKENQRRKSWRKSERELIANRLRQNIEHESLPGELRYNFSNDPDTITWDLQTYPATYWNGDYLMGKIIYKVNSIGFVSVKVEPVKLPHLDERDEQVHIIENVNTEDINADWVDDSVVKALKTLINLRKE